MKKDSLEKILKFRKVRDWEQYHLPKNLAISLVLEAAEVLELFQWTKDHNLSEERREEMSDELADVYCWLLLLAHDFNIDLDQALEQKLKKNEGKYPVEKSKGKSTKYDKL